MFAQRFLIRLLPARRGRAAALAGVAAFALLAAGCETRQEWLTKSRVHSVERGLLRAIYLKGQRPEKLSLETRMAFYKVPGACVAVMDRNRLEWVRAYGVRDVHSREPVTADTIFQAGALGQPVAAAAALRLVDQGRLDLDGDLAPRLRGLKLPAEGPEPAGRVTLRGILSYADGLTRARLPGYSSGQKIPALIDLVANAESCPPAADAATSDVGFAVLQVLLEGVTSTRFPSLARTVVFDPLGMKDSTFDTPLPEALDINAASGHLRDGKPVEGRWLTYPAAASSGLWTTTPDLVAFVADVLETAMGNDGKVLTAGSARAMLTPQSAGRGLGFEVDGAGQDLRFHLDGRTGGFAGTLVVYPYKGQGAVVLTNSDNGSLLAEEILRAVSATYDWPDWKPRERPLFRLDPSIYRQYVGRYQVTPDYALDVAYEDYYLVIRPTGQAATKFFVESQTFFFSIDPYVRIQFLSDDKGRITGLVLWQQDFKQEAKKIG